MSVPRRKAPALCFDNAADELALAIVDVHERLAEKRGFNPEVPGPLRDEQAGRVAAVVASSFCTYFGSKPKDRYSDVFEQVACFASNLSRDHIFPDANKRTTVLISIAILYVAGSTLDIEDITSPEKNELYLWIQSVVTRDKSPEELAEILRGHSIEVPKS